MDHLTRPVVVLDDVFQDLAHLRQVGGAGAEKTLRRLHVAQNGGERLIELVRQRRRQLAHRGEARHVGKLRAMALRLVLGRAPFLDGGRQEHHGNGDRDQEQLQREHVVGCGAASKRPEPADSAGDRQHGEDQETRIGADRTESHRRPEQQRQRQIHQRRDGAVPCRRPMEDAEADGEEPAADQPRLDATRDRGVAHRAGTGNPGQDRRCQCQIREGLGQKPHAPIEPVAPPCAREGSHECGHERGRGPPPRGDRR